MSRQKNEHDEAPVVLSSVPSPNLELKMSKAPLRLLLASLLVSGITVTAQASQHAEQSSANAQQRAEERGEQGQQRAAERAEQGQQRAEERTEQRQQRAEERTEI